MPQDPPRAFHYTEQYVRQTLPESPWENGTRRVFVQLYEEDSAWTPIGTVDGPGGVVWIQYEDKSIETVITKLDPL